MYTSDNSKVPRWTSQPEFCRWKAHTNKDNFNFVLDVAEDVPRQRNQAHQSIASAFDIRILHFAKFTFWSRATASRWHDISSTLTAWKALFMFICVNILRMINEAIFRFQITSWLHSFTKSSQRQFAFRCCSGETLYGLLIFFRLS